MNLKVVNTGSSGNCYLLESEHQTLIIECGVRFSEIKKALNYNLSKVVGCLLTHEHGDHAFSAKELMNHGVDVYSSNGTFDALNLSDRSELFCKKEVEILRSYKVGEFKVSVFDSCHDCKEPVNFLIEHEDMGKLLFVTDSYKIKYSFDNVDHYLIEANYSIDIVNSYREKGRTHFTDQRLIKSHMSIEALEKYLTAQNLINTKNIILHHLSGRNSDAKQFQERIEGLTGVKTYIASNGNNYELNKTELNF